MKKALRIFKIILLSLFLLIALILVAVPRVAKSYINDNSKTYLGRRIEIKNIRVNYFASSIKISELKLYELDDRELFVGFDKLKINLALWPSLKGDYTVSSFLLDGLYLNVESNDSVFNFSDLIPPADTSKVDTTQAEGEQNVNFTIEKFRVKNSEIHYKNHLLSTEHSLKSIEVSLPYFSMSDSVPSELIMSFIPNRKGKLELKAEIDMHKDLFQVQTQLEHFDLSQFSNYLQDYLLSDGLEGYLDYDLSVNGRLSKPEEFALNGELELNNFLLKDDSGRAVSSYDLFGVYFDSIAPSNNNFAISKMTLDSLAFNYEIYSEGSSIDRLLSPLFRQAEQDSIQADSLVADTLNSDTVRFFVDTIMVNGGAIQLADYSLHQDFNYRVDHINIALGGLDYNAERVPVDFSMFLNSEAKLQGEATINMQNSNKLEYKAVVNELDLTAFAPYSEFYIARPLESGHLNFSGDAYMSDDAFVANNHIRINDINLGSKTGVEPIVKAPVKMALGILKDVNGDVAIDLPIKGNPSSPDFSVGKLVAKTLSDFVIKVAATPFAAVRDVVGVDPERLKELSLDIAVAELGKDNQKRLDQVVKSIQKKPDLKFVFALETSQDRERLALAINELKRRYIASDSLDIAVKDLRNDNNEFLAFVHSQSTAPAGAKFNDKCLNTVGEEWLTNAEGQLKDKRIKELKDYLFNHHNITEGSVTIRNAVEYKKDVDLKKPRFRVEVSMK